MQISISKQPANGYFRDQKGLKGHNNSLGLSSNEIEQSPRDIILHVFFFFPPHMPHLSSP